MKSNLNESLVEVSFEDTPTIYPFYLRENTSDVAVFEQIMQRQEYNIKIDFEPKVIIDCGANIGLAAIYFKYKYPKAKIICVEPEEHNYNMLLRNMKPYNDITCIKSGIWNQSTYLSIVDAGLGNWGFMVKEVDKYTSDAIPALSIDSIMKDHEIEYIDILKIDIEGSEKEVFELNFKQWLSKTRILIIEVHDRMRAGSSKALFKAVSTYDFSTSISGENIVFYFHHHSFFPIKTSLGDL